MQSFPSFLVGRAYNMTISSPVINVSGLQVTLQNKIILNNVDFLVRRGEIVAIAGGSGSGKTTLLRSILR